MRFLPVIAAGLMLSSCMMQPAMAQQEPTPQQMELFQAAAATGALHRCTQENGYKTNTAQLAFAKLKAIFKPFASDPGAKGQEARLNYQFLVVGISEGTFFTLNADKTDIEEEFDVKTNDGACEQADAMLRNMLAPGGILNTAPGEPS